MQSASYIVVSRQAALMRQMDVVANNIANAGTPGFKGEHMLFAEYLQEGPGGSGISYVHDLSTVRDGSPGELRATGNDLDLAIQGDGYLVAETPAGDRYTRNGHLQLDADRRVVTSHGYPVLTEGGQTLVVPVGAADLSITPDGIVSAGEQELGRLNLVRFENEGALKKTLGGLYTTDEEPLPALDARVLQGMTESSNIQPVLEMTRMMEVHRAFQSVQNMLNGEHERMTRAIRELPRTEPS